MARRLAAESPGGDEARSPSGLHMGLKQSMLVMAEQVITNRAPQLKPQKLHIAASVANTHLLLAGSTARRRARLLCAG